MQPADAAIIRDASANLRNPTGINITAPFYVRTYVGNAESVH